MKKRIRQANRKFSLGQTENELGQNMYQFFLDETYNDCTAKRTFTVENVPDIVYLYISLYNI